MLTLAILATPDEVRFTARSGLLMRFVPADADGVRMCLAAGGALDDEGVEEGVFWCVGGEEVGYAGI